MIDCIHPILLPKLGFEVPCGKCALCRLAQRKDWSLRLLLEAKSYRDKVSFLTITYNEENLTEELVYSDVQKFLKRLRKAIFPRKIRYFVAGEYGGLRHRPHFHFILYGLDFNDKEIIEKSWDKGFVKVGSFNSARARYCAGYVQKKLQFSMMSNILKKYGLKDLSLRERIVAVAESPFLMKVFDDNHLDMNSLYIQPFSHCSNRPGIGYNWYQDHKEELRDKRYICLGNFKYRIPKYFKRMLFQDFPELRDEIIADFSLFDEEQYVKFLKKYPEKDYDDFLDYSYGVLQQKVLEIEKKNDMYLDKKNLQMENYYVN